MTRPIHPADERRNREIRRAQEDILAAAARVYAEHGIEGSTVRRIAEAAGYTPAALYSYFHGKEQIFCELAAQMRQSMLATFEVRLPANLDFAHKLELLLTRQLELLQSQWQSCLVYFVLRGMGTPDCDADDQPHQAGLVALHARMIAWLDQAGAERAIAMSCDEAAYVLVGLTVAKFRQWLQTHSEQPLVDMAPRIVHLFLYGAANEPRPTP